MKKRFVRLSLQALLLMALSFDAFAQPATGLVKVIVSPDHKDWTYRINQEARFTVQVLKYGNLMDNVSIDYEAGPEMIPEIKKEGVILKNGLLEFPEETEMVNNWLIRKLKGQ
jgi:cephalosporin-C deacetylase